MKKIIHTEKFPTGNDTYVVLVFDDFSTEVYKHITDLNGNKASDLAEALHKAKASISIR